MNFQLSTVNCKLLFVYGTLRRGFRLHGVLERLGAQYVRRGNIQGELFDLGDFPGARKTESSGGSSAGLQPGTAALKGGATLVVGEVYQLQNPARALKSLDEVEGFRSHAPAGSAGSLFRREIVWVTLQNGERLSAWVYWLNRASVPGRRIDSGDYAKKG